MTYHYEDRPGLTAELERVIRKAFDVGSTLQRGSRSEDFGGIDATYTVDHAAPLQIRARFNRPAGSHLVDVTFRTTEPRMIAARTYAPLMFVCWVKVAPARAPAVYAAHLVDVYRMHERITPAVGARPPILNPDGVTGFHSVGVAELVAAGALLEFYDGEKWGWWATDARRRVQRIIRDDGARQAAG